MRPVRGAFLQPHRKPAMKLRMMSILSASLMATMAAESVGYARPALGTIGHKNNVSPSSKKKATRNQAKKLRKSKRK